MRMRAALLREPALPVEIREVELAPPRAAAAFRRLPSGDALRQLVVF